MDPQSIGRMIQILKWLQRYNIFADCIDLDIIGSGSGNELLDRGIEEGT